MNKKILFLISGILTGIGFLYYIIAYLIDSSYDIDWIMTLVFMFFSISAFSAYFKLKKSES
ncbi:hypothetical protein CLV90_2712 [Maribacter spongiicola]|uniref:Uncharacterized protein n=1 Tax=Maribacter spongiicola TaxID=1206753 RepID=A0A4R7K3W2_9FLAO|nr:hypothetical protein [Maribacter spongiicola]TDT45622.1 hypothetical protein CLV90_2712 [Maribacter spongiicola]